VELKPLTLNGYPGSSDYPGADGQIEDSPDAREALEKCAIPRCREWREANPEPCTRMLPGADGTEHTHPAPYCCSAYCTRCAGLRALDGVDPLQPNEWMDR
jgi:hypothetical protein